ncbi:MAG TPA: glycosyltransferase [Rhizobiales bacterium]|nr:D-inositol 3-phosphate glycosyltransferase [bacterium BMS3Bbin10]HDO51615.1 glycosyltransferase [Hyphomicrobiales bacterium]
MNSIIHAASVLQIIPRLDTGGAELATVEITEALTRAGARAFVMSEGGRMADDVTRAGGVIVPFAAATKNPARMIANAVRLARFVRDTGVDIIHARSRAPAWSALMAARATGTAFVTTYHGAYGNRGFLKPLYNSVMARGDLVIANSNFTGALVAERHATPQARIRVIQRGVDLTRFDPAAIDAGRIASLRKKWGVNDGARIVLHPARLTGWKGQSDVIDAAARIFRAGSTGEGAVFILAGDAQGRAAYVSMLERQIASDGLEGRVRLVGHCDDMAAAYAAAHVTLIASTEPEAFGRTSAEAQAMGCPVIVTRQGASPETLLTAARDGAEAATGWIVPVAAPAALANAIAEALSLSHRDRAAMAARARALVSERFSSEEMKRQTLAVYDECLRSALVTAFDDAGDDAGAPASRR